MDNTYISLWSVGIFLCTGLSRYKWQAVRKVAYVTNLLGKKVKHETKYDYDKNGNLISETDWLGNKISYVYDSLNRVIEKKDQYNK